MKHSEKIFLLLAVAVLGASVYYWHSSMPLIASKVSNNRVMLGEVSEGVKWKDIVMPQLSVNSIEWPEVRAQDEEGKWFFQVFTPPQIWIDKKGVFMTESPYYKEAARQQFAYSFGGVSNEPYYIEYRGHFGSIKSPFIQLKDIRSGRVMQGKLNSEIVIPATNFTKAVNTGITVKSFDVKRVKKPNGMLDNQITVKLFDKELGKDVEIYSFKQTVLPDQRRMTLKASDGSLWHIKSKGEKMTKGDADYEIVDVDLDKEFALVKMISKKDKGDVRVMKVSASGVEDK